MTRVRVYGADNLARTLDAAAARMGELSEPARAAARATLAAARGLAPRRTGTLANSLQAGVWGPNTAAVTSALPYAGVIHWGWPAREIPARPFVTEAAQTTEPAWVARYEQHVTRTLDTVKGI
ncbi:hypothetical protein [Nocardia rhizosphaerae]|uniref:HK97 gp10 family phage protein n=1 Tax=Nocardia rhizosphaerae TaxID=1691571 RepID=A0ABV8LAW6_9NOCA